MADGDRPVRTLADTGQQLAFATRIGQYPQKLAVFRQIAAAPQLQHGALDLGAHQLHTHALGTDAGVERQANDAVLAEAAIVGQLEGGALIIHQAAGVEHDAVIDPFAQQRRIGRGEAAVVLGVPLAGAHATQQLSAEGDHDFIEGRLGGGGECQFDIAQRVTVLGFQRQLCATDDHRARGALELEGEAGGRPGQGVGALQDDEAIEAVVGVRDLAGDGVPVRRCRGGGVDQLRKLAQGEGGQTATTAGGQLFQCCAQTCIEVTGRYQSLFAFHHAQRAAGIQHQDVRLGSHRVHLPEMGKPAL